MMDDELLCPICNKSVRYDRVSHQPPDCRHTTEEIFDYARSLREQMVAMMGMSKAIMEHLMILGDGEFKKEAEETLAEINRLTDYYMDSNNKINKIQA
jgi:hypothetical protein